MKMRGGTRAQWREMVGKERGVEKDGYKGLPYSPERSESGLHSCSLYRPKIITMTDITSHEIHSITH